MEHKEAKHGKLSGPKHADMPEIDDYERPELEKFEKPEFGKSDKSKKVSALFDLAWNFCDGNQYNRTLYVQYQLFLHLDFFVLMYFPRENNPIFWRFQFTLISMKVWNVKSVDSVHNEIGYFVWCFYKNDAAATTVRKNAWKIFLTFNIQNVNYTTDEIQLTD